MVDQSAELRATLERYHKLLRATDDPAAHEAVLGAIAELEARLRIVGGSAAYSGDSGRTNYRRRDGR
jgi:hypothetical protein